MSEFQPATGIVFRKTGGGYSNDFHNAPGRQYVLQLEGALEVETGAGQKTRIEAGEVLLGEDTTGQGHITRAVDGRPVLSIFVTLD